MEQKITTGAINKLPKLGEADNYIVGPMYDGHKEKFFPVKPLWGRRFRTEGGDP